MLYGFGASLGCRTFFMGYASHSNLIVMFAKEKCPTSLVEHFLAVRMGLMVGYL